MFDAKQILLDRMCHRNGDFLEWGQSADTSPMHIIALMQEAYRAGQESLRELVNDLRGYTHDWDWKYGEEWDAAIARIGNEVNP